MKYNLPLLCCLLFLSSGFGQEPAKKKKKNPPVPEGVEVLRNLPYTPANSYELLLDLYRPLDIKGPLPVVVWVHGGGWKNGSKDKTPAVFLAQHGFAVASINYRLTDVAQWPAQINDCHQAVRWLRAQAATYQLDADHIGVWGSSAGGHLVALMGTRPTDAAGRVQAVCDWFGPSELMAMPPNNVGKGRSAEDVANSNGAKLLGVTVREAPELAADASALDQVSADDAPFLIMHGSVDPGVPLSQSRKLHEKLKAAGVDSTLHIVEGAGHGGALFKSDEVQATVLKFFKRTLSPRSP